MFRSIDTPAQNSVVINGSLLGFELRDGKTSAAKGAKPYRGANATIRVNQYYNGKEEISEIPVSFIAMRHKKDGTNNLVYDTLGGYSTEYKTAERHGIENATKVNINGRRGNGALSENMFADSRNPETVISSWNINASFLNEARGQAAGNSGDCATFDAEIFIFGLDREVTAEGEETGRLKIRGGLVKYGGKVDCLDFFVENPTAIDFIERNYNQNDTAHFVGRIRFTSETITRQSENTWGESIPQTTTRKKRELIITGPGIGHEDGPNEEENSYNPEDIRVAMADRNTLKEQKKIEARAKAKTGKAAPAAATSSAAPTYDWEE